MVKALSPDVGSMTAPALESQRTNARPRPLTVEELATENRRHDRILAGLTILLAFLLASFPVPNPDIWMQIRTGQLIASGEFSFGVDPFTYANPQLWVHTAWLWDVLIYGIHALGGGVGLVLFRGALMAGLALLLFQIRRRDATLLPVVLSLALAFVAMSARMFLRSELISVVFVGLTLYLLWRPAAPPRFALTGKLLGLTRNHAWVFLPVVFALWANCDYWFFLGPCLVLLYLAGEYVQDIVSGGRARPDGLSGGDQRTLLVVLLAGTVACLLNPYTIRIFFQLPGDSVSEALDLVLLNQPSLKQGALRPILSPFSPLYFQGILKDEFWWRPLGLSVAEWAFYPLAVLSGLSFIVNYRETRLWRLFIWVALFALTAWQARNIGFFAVVAGPIMALNFQDWMAARTSSRTGLSVSLVIAGQLSRILALVTLLTLCFLMTIRLDAPTLQVRGRETALGCIHTRALGWSMLTDPSMRGVSEQLTQWKLPGHGFTLDWREQPNYLAYFGPGNQSFLDSRLLLHGKTAAEYYAIANAIKETSPGRREPGPTNDHFTWQDAFKKHDISYLLINAATEVPRRDPSASGGIRFVRLVDLLLFDEIETKEAGGVPVRKKVWELLGYIDGRTFILAWTGSPRYEQLKALQFDPEREAFRAPKLTPAGAGPTGEVPASPTLRWLAGQIDRPPQATDEANWLLEYSARTYSLSRRQAISGGLQTLTHYPSMSMPGAFAFAPPLLGMDPLSVAPHQLAIRAARRAVAEQPDNSAAHYQLYHAYNGTYPIELELGGMPLAVREFQLISSLRQAVALRPQEPVFQLELSMLYLRLRMADLAVLHFDGALRGAEGIGLNREAFAVRVSEFPELRHLLELFPLMEKQAQEIASRKASFNARAALTSDPNEHARVAIQLGLTDEARQAMEKVILMTQPQASSPTGNVIMRQLADLYLRMGYLPEMLALLSRPDAPTRLGSAVFNQRAALARAAAGDYAGSLRHFQALETEMGQAAVEAALFGVSIPTRGGNSELPGSMLRGLEQSFQGQEVNAQRAEILVQAGLVALEAGYKQPSPVHPDAPGLFKKAVLEVYPACPSRPLAVRYYRLMTNRWMDE